MRASILALCILNGACGTSVASAEEAADATADETSVEVPDLTPVPIVPPSPTPTATPDAEEGREGDVRALPLVPLGPRSPRNPRGVPPAPSDGASTERAPAGGGAADAAALPTPPGTTTAQQRPAWLRTPRLIAYGGVAVGLAVTSAGIASGLDAREAESSYRRASTQVDAFAARQRGERAGKRANILFVAGGAVTAAAVGVVAFDAFGVFDGADRAPSSAVGAPHVGLVPITGGAIGVWTFTFPSPQ